jgi:hypothetical protein
MAATRGWVSQSEAARREGVSQPYVAKLIKQGRLEKDDAGRVRLVQLRAVRATDLDPSRGHHKAQQKVPSAVHVDPPQDPPNRGFTAARTRREEQQAVLAELDVRKRTGELVEWSKVEAMNASTAVMVRESLLAIPDRLAAVLAAETDERRVRQLLDSELRTALASLAASLKKPA